MWVDTTFNTLHFPPMNERVRLNLEVAPELYRDLAQIAQESDTSMTNVVRLSLALYKVCHDAKRGGKHIGLTTDPDKLDTLIVGLI